MISHNTVDEGLKALIKSCTLEITPDSENYSKDLRDRTGKLSMF
jgi:hypothetical protein